MAHELFGDRFLERNTGDRAWHGLGEVFGIDEKITVADAMKRAGLDYSVIKVPEFARLPNGDMVETGQFLVYRESHTFNGKTDPGKFISKNPVSDSYTIIDNLQIAGMMETLATAWPVETVGSLKSGAVVFATLDGGEFDINGDPCHNYFLVSDGKDGLRSLRVDVTPVRVVCANTLRMGISAASFSVKVEHNANATRELNFWTEAIPQIAESAKRTREAMQLLADTKAKKADVERVINAAFPEPKRSDMARHADLVPLTLSADAAETLKASMDMSDYHADRVAGIRSAAWERYEAFGDENKGLGGTLWAAFNAANEVSCWRKGHAATVDESVVFGSRADESKRASKEAIMIATKGKGFNPN